MVFSLAGGEWRHWLTGFLDQPVFLYRAMVGVNAVDTAVRAELVEA
jgi:hypothetical protein